MSNNRPSGFSNLRMGGQSILFVIYIIRTPLSFELPVISLSPCRAVMSVACSVVYPSPTLFLSLSLSPLPHATMTQLQVSLEYPHRHQLLIPPTEVIREKVQDGLTGETKEMQYTQCKVVGNGSFGVVFQTKLSPSGEDAAIKRVLQDKRFKVRWTNGLSYSSA